MRRRDIVAALALSPSMAWAGGRVERRSGTRYKLGLNAYSFNRELLSGAMSMADVIDFCAEQEIDGVDMTGYYFPGYPEPPSDEVIYDLKRTAFLNGVTISGTGVRNDFALPEASSRKAQIQLVKNWVEVSAKLGADVLRVFSGRQLAPERTFDETLEWMVPAFQECADYGRRHGVIIGLQHHHDVLKTAAETIRLVEAVSSDWFSVVLDVGSLRTEEVYAEIERLVPYAATWQIKQEVWYGENPKPLDLPRLKAIVDRSGYRGFLPVEALGQDADLPARRRSVARFVTEVRRAFFS